MKWTANKRDGAIHNRAGRLVATTELGQRQHTNMMGQAPEMRRLLERCMKATAGHDSRLAYDIQRVLNKAR